MRRAVARGLPALAAACWMAMAAADTAELDTIAALDVPRYMGSWHQIAHLPNRFQAVCAAETRANYSLLDDGRVRVVNECRDANGNIERADGVARPNRDWDDAARLEVRFAPAWLSFLPFVWGDYWILELEPDYSAALVGAPNRAYLWVLARTESLPRETYARLVDTARRQGFAVEELRLEHPAAVD